MKEPIFRINRIERLKNKKKIEKLFQRKTIIVPLDDMDRFQKKRNEENNTSYRHLWYDWLINHIPEYRSVRVLKIKLKIF